MNWTPADAYCRTCGAEVIEPAAFGAARMLKDAGVDRFSIRTRLSSMEPAQRDNLTRIYQRHATVAGRLVDDVHRMESALHHRGFAVALEERLLPELPWPDDVLRRYEVPRASVTAADDVGLDSDLDVDLLAAARRIEVTSPVEVARELAALVRLRLDEFDAVAAACAAFSSADPAVRAEAALVLTSWRVHLGAGRVDDRVAGGSDAVIAALRSSAFLADAAVRLATLTRDGVDIPPEAIDSDDRELAVGATLLSRDPHRLAALLDGDPMERLAAADVLAAMGIVLPLVPLLRAGPDEFRSVVLHTLALARAPQPDLDDVLVEIVETTTDDAVRELAARVACPSIGVGQALRIARAAGGDRRITQSLLQRTSLPPDGLAELVDLLLQSGSFSTQTFGASSLAEDGRLADRFVPSRYGEVAPSMRPELLALAELQLAQRGDPDLHSFVLCVVFGAEGGEIRATAWWVLHRWYASLGEYRGRGPFRLEPSVVAQHFGSCEAFVPMLTAVVLDDDALRRVGFFEFVADLLSGADDEFVHAVQTMDRAGHELVEALSIAVTRDYWPQTFEAMATLLSRIAVREPWRQGALDALRSLSRDGNHHYDAALKRLGADTPLA